MIPRSISNMEMCSFISYLLRHYFVPEHWLRGKRISDRYTLISGSYSSSILRRGGQKCSAASLGATLEEEQSYGGLSKGSLRKLRFERCSLLDQTRIRNTRCQDSLVTFKFQWQSFKIVDFRNCTCKESARKIKPEVEYVLKALVLFL